MLNRELISLCRCHSLSIPGWFTVATVLAESIAEGINRLCVPVHERCNERAQVHASLLRTALTLCINEIYP